ncbi:MAG TPA: substrate-binding domain-containing protein [Lacunisphaera sp.]
MTKRYRLAIYLQLHTGFALGLLRGLAQFARRHPNIDLLKFAKPASYQPFELRALKLNGIIAKVSSREDEAVLGQLGIPVVNISGQILTPSLPTLNTDDRRVGELAFGHFFRRGYRAVAYCGPRDHRASLLRRKGLAEAALAHDCRCDYYALKPEEENFVMPGQLRRTLATWLKTLPTGVGVLCFTDRVALAVAEAAEVARRRVPADIAILGVGNDLTRLDFAHTEISSIELPSPQIGLAAAELLLDLIRRRRKAATETLFQPPKIVTRRSTDHFAVADGTVALALDYIREHRSNTIYVDAIARAAGVSRRALEQRFRAALGLSIYSVVQRVHLERAQELMADPELSLAEISYASGYENQRHLNVAFRRLLQTTPGQYRASLGTDKAGKRR